MATEKGGILLEESINSFLRVWLVEQNLSNAAKMSAPGADHGEGFVECLNCPYRCFATAWSVAGMCTRYEGRTCEHCQKNMIWCLDCRLGLKDRRGALQHERRAHEPCAAEVDAPTDHTEGKEEHAHVHDGDQCSTSGHPFAFGQGAVTEAMCRREGIDFKSVRKDGEEVPMAWPASEASVSYMRREQQVPGSGAAALVSGVLRGHSVGDDLPAKHVHSILRLLALAMKLPGTDRDELVRVVHGIASACATDGTGGVCPETEAREKIWDGADLLSVLPRNGAEVESMLTRTGVEGLAANIPGPVPFMVDKDHAMVLASECIMDLLGRGCKVDGIRVAGESDTPDFVQDISRSKRARRIYEVMCRSGGREATRLWLIDWSDEFEKNATKQNRKGIWSCVLTIATPPGAVHTAVNSYLLGLGPGKADHSAVFERHNADLQVLLEGKWMYQSTLQCATLVQGLLFVRIQDDPERRGGLLTTLGGGLMTGRYGYVASRRALIGKLASCSSCAASRRAGGWHES